MKKTLKILTLVVVFSIVVGVMFFYGLDQPIGSTEISNATPETVVEEENEEATGELLTIPHYYQKDPAWANVPVDEGTIGEVGDRVTALAMVASYLSEKEVTPAEVAESSYMYLGDEAYLEEFANSYDAVLNDAGLNGGMVLAALQFKDAVVAETAGNLFGGRMVVVAGHSDDGFLILDPDNETETVVSDDEFLADVTHLWIFA